MKKTILATLLLACSVATIAQTRADYDAAMSKFRKYYNLQQGDSIYNMMSDRSKTIMPHDKIVQTFKQVYGQMGELQSYEFTKEKDNSSYYKSVFSNATVSLILSLNKSGQLEKFLFLPYKPDTSVADPSRIFLKTATGDIFGTLTMPDVSGPVPVVLIIAGSGPTDRDGNNMMGAKTNAYKMIADSLQRAGIACVRYDKRGIGASATVATTEGKTTFDDFVNDAAGFIKMLRSDNRFSKVFVLGHSEGSLISFIAAQKELVSGIISVAGAAERIDKLVELQLAAQSAELAEKATVIFDSLKKGYTVKYISADMYDMFHTSVQPFLRSWLQYEPKEEIKKIHEPVLIVQGTNDLQVPMEEAKKLKKACPNSMIVLVDGMNHVLKQAPSDRTQNFATYSNPDLPLCPGFMEPIVFFIKTPPPPISKKERLK
jgi:uncharacterized protein